MFSNSLVQHNQFIKNNLNKNSFYLSNRYLRFLFFSPGEVNNVNMEVSKFFGKCDQNEIFNYIFKKIRFWKSRWQFYFFRTEFYLKFKFKFWRMCCGGKNPFYNYCSFFFDIPNITWFLMSRFIFPRLMYFSLTPTSSFYSGSFIACFKNEILAILLPGFYSIFSSIIVVVPRTTLWLLLIHDFLLNLSVFRTDFWAFIPMKTSTFLSMKFLSFFTNHHTSKTSISVFSAFGYSPSHRYLIITVRIEYVREFNV